MSLSERLQLARGSYRGALERARRRNTPTSWRRLVRAGQNLRDTEAALRRDVERRAPRPRRSVLLVEDDRVAREALRDILSERLDVWMAADGQTALDLLHRMRTPPAAIVLDLMLPKMNGWDLRRELEREPALARIPVLVMSACRDAGVRAARVFEKPFDPSELLGALSKLAR